MNRKYNILLQFDEQIEQSIVLIKNIILQSDKKLITFHIFHSSNSTLDYQIKWMKENDIYYIFYPINESETSFIRTNRVTYPHVSNAAFYKLLVGEIINENIQSILYLDLDLYIKGNVIDIFKEIDDISPIIVAEEMSGFNTGVVLFNLKPFRKILPITEIKRLMIQYNFPSDNEFLEFVFRYSHKKISFKWNFKVQSEIIELNFSELYYKRLSEARIIHFVGTTKPWRFSTNLPFTLEWRKLYTSIYNRKPWDKVALKEVLLRLLYIVFPNPKNLFKVHKFIRELIHD